MNRAAIARTICAASAMAAFDIVCPASGLSLEIEPLNITNLSPLVHSAGIPVETTAHLLPKGRYQLSITEDIASIYTRSSIGNEQLQLDGELYRSRLAIRYGVAQNIEIGAELPVITQGGGFLDQTIIDWHNFWGLPQGGRDSTANNHLGYSYTKNSVPLINMDKSGTNVGDISLQAAWQALDYRNELSRNTLALRGQVKLPTGDSNSLSGNGSTSAAILLAASSETATNYGTFGIFGSIGSVVSTTGKILPDQQKHIVGTSTLGTGWSPHKDVSLKLQLNTTTPLYGSSQLTEISGSTAMIGAGATFRLEASYLLDLGFSEDIAVSTAPDITFHVRLARFF